MAYEVVQKLRVGRSSYGSIWATDPCIAITKAGLTFNSKFLETFGVQKGSGLILHVDRENRRIGIKIATDETDMANSFSVHAGGNNKAKASLIVTCIAMPKTFRESIGKAFTARLNPGQRIIEVQL